MNPLNDLGSKLWKRLQAFADRPGKAANPIGGTFLSRQNVEKPRTIAEGCIDFSVL
jgi:hypothetical protein